MGGLENESRRVIMVVDDQEGNREVLGIFLGWIGYTVIEATNGLEALKLATRDCPDLIIMDLAMPVMDGFTAVRLLRDLPQTRDVPIVATPHMTQSCIVNRQPAPASPTF